MFALRLAKFASPVLMVFSNSAPNGFRVESDTMGDVLVPESALWGAQTQRSLQNFKAGTEYRLPREAVHAFIAQKLAAARANSDHLPPGVGRAITETAEEILAQEFSTMDKNSDIISTAFPLTIFQTGSGTQSNMNVNEVLASLATQKLPLKGPVQRVHPNDHVPFLFITIS